MLWHLIHKPTLLDLHSRILDAETTQIISMRGVSLNNKVVFK